MNKKGFIILSLILLLFFFSNIIWGSVFIPIKSVITILSGNSSGKSSWDFIILHSRLPQAFTAMFAGASLATAGLLLQSIFNNPLAGPSILGIDSGASLGVAVSMLFIGGSLGGLIGITSVSGYLAIIISAFIGSVIVLGIIIFFSTFIRNNLMLLIIGIMVGYFSSAIISILNFFGSEQNVFAYTIWGMGDFSAVSSARLIYFCGLITIGLLISLLMIKPLNALLLGERYAVNLGVNVRRTRLILLLSTGLLTAVTTAFCGPISFIGLAVPHISRLIFKTGNNKILLPATMLSGGVIALLCNLISNMPGYSIVIPLNAITALVGSPIIIYVIITQTKKFN